MAERHGGKWGKFAVRLLFWLAVIVVAIGLVSGAVISVRAAWPPPQTAPQSSSSAPQSVAPSAVPPTEPPLSPKPGKEPSKVRYHRSPRVQPEPSTHNGDTYINSGVNTGHMGPVIVSPTEPNVLYQDGRRIGTIEGAVATGVTIQFAQIRFTDSADPTRNIDFQRFSMRCNIPPIVSDAAIFLDVVPNVTCRVTQVR